jgi:flagellar biogenesis protein FliO
VPAAPSWWRIAAMVAILLLLLFVWWKVNRGRLGLDRLLKPGTQRLVLGEQRWVNGRTVVCIVEVDGERFLLAQTTGAVAWQPLAKGTPAKQD